MEFAFRRVVFFFPSYFKALFFKICMYYMKCDNHSDCSVVPARISTCSIFTSLLCPTCHNLLLIILV